jgi:hypothetical protein
MQYVFVINLLLFSLLFITHFFGTGFSAPLFYRRRRSAKSSAILKLFSFLFSALAVVYFIGFVMHLQDKQSGSAGSIFL